jgi:DNA-binding NarL/FixJ family response regulator
MIRVLLADDQALVRAGFRMLLQSAPDITVAGEAANGGAAVALARDLVPDVVLMDLSMPEVDGVTATQRIVADPGLARVRVVALTTFGDNVKDVEPAELLQAVRVVARGDALLSPSVTRSLIAAVTAPGGAAAGDTERTAAGRPAPDRPGSAGGQSTTAAPTGRAGLAALTGREREVVGLVAAGLSNDEIASRLVVSPFTAKTHVSRAMTKLGARDRAQLVVIAYQCGIAGAPG